MGNDLSIAEGIEKLAPRDPFRVQPVHAESVPMACSKRHCLIRYAPPVVRILESVLYAEDLMAAKAFYSDLLGLEVILFDPERDLFLRCEGSVLILFKASRTVIHDGKVPAHGTTEAGHLAFAASREEIDNWSAKLESAGVAIIETIDWENGARSIYFNDPAGNVLEFATPSLWGMA